MLYPCLLSNIIYPLYLGGGCGRGVGHPNILRGGAPPAITPWRPPEWSGPERLQTLRYGYPSLQSSSGAPPEAPERRQDASNALLDRPKW